MKNDLTNRIGYVYKIISPNNKIYVGQTINLYHRKRDYKYNCFKTQLKLWNNCKKYNWNPIDTFEVIEECLCGENKIYLNEREKYWIKFYDSFINGLNCTNGGVGQIGHKQSEETKEKLRKINLGKKHTEETKRKQKESAKNTILSIEAKEKKLQGGRNNKGKKISEETKEKLRKINLGKKHTEETKEKCRLISIGRKMSDEAKLKISEAKKGKHLSEETKEKMSNSHKGKIPWNKGLKHKQ